MRVDLVARHYRPVVGGIETHVEHLARAIQRRGHDVVVHALNQDTAGGVLPSSERIDRVAVQRYPANVKLGYYTTRFQPKLEGDIVHLHGYGLWTHDRLARRFPSRPKLMTLHHGLHIPAATPVHAAYHWYHRRFTGRGTLRRMDAVIASTPLDAERLRRSGFPMERVHVIPMGVPAQAFRPAAPQPPPEGWDAYLLYLGRLHREKSVDHAIRALTRLPARVGLIIAGPDEGERGALEALTRRLDVEPRVRFLGRLESDQKRALLRGARALVLPSKYEGFGIVIVEAWAQGTPVVAANVGGVPYLVDEAQDGLLYPWGKLAGLVSRARSLLEDETAAKRLGAAGRRKAETLREEPLLDRVVNLYVNLGRGA